MSSVVGGEPVVGEASDLWELEDSGRALSEVEAFGEVEEEFSNKAELKGDLTIVSASVQRVPEESGAAEVREETEAVREGAEVMGWLDNCEGEDCVMFCTGDES